MSKSYFLKLFLFLMMFSPSFAASAAFGGKTAAKCSVKPSSSTGYYVFRTIQDAIDASYCSKIVVQSGTYYENLQIKRDVTITGSSSSATIIDGSSAGRVVQIASKLNVTLNTLTIQNGYAWAESAFDGGGILSYGYLTLNNVDFTSNVANRGGAIYQYGGSLKVSSSSFTDNTAGSGAVIYATKSDIIVQKSEFTENDGTYGAVIYGTSNTDVAVSESSFTEGTSSFGGAFYLYDGGDFSMEDSQCENNEVTGGGGCIFAVELDSITLTSTEIDGNKATGSGNGGGGIYARDVTSLSVDASTIAENSTGYLGGGIFSDGTESVSILNSTFSSNSADSSGGALYLIDGTVSIVQSTIYQNTAVSSGGGLSQRLSDTTITLSIISDNEATGASYYDDCSISGVFTSSGDNLFGDTSCWDETGDVVGEDVKLGALQDNGGSTKTHMPDADSPAVEGGGRTCSDDYDQRGAARPYDGDSYSYEYCDIGAVEYGSPVS